MLVEDLKPFIDATYKTFPGAANTAVGGSSLGGLLTMHLGLRYPTAFGKLAVLSPSVWWDDRAILREVEALAGKRAQRIWLDAGVREGERVIGDSRLLRDALVAKGWVLGDDLEYFEAEGGEHNERSWGARVGPMLEFLFPHNHEPRISPLVQPVARPRHGSARVRPRRRARDRVSDLDGKVLRVGGPRHDHRARRARSSADGCSCIASTAWTTTVGTPSGSSRAIARAAMRSYDAYVRDEVVPLRAQGNSNPFLMTTGASFGAYHAVTFALRYPQLVGRAIGMSGMYDIGEQTDGYSDATIYHYNPADFIQGEHDPERLAR